MMRMLPGIGVLIIVGILYFISYRKSRQSKYAAAIALIIVCSLILRIYLSLDMYLHEWDERYHALVAKNIIKHPLMPTLYDNPVLGYDYRNWLGNHIWVHKQPLPLWSMAASMSVFGINEMALRFPSIFLSTLAVLLTYLIGINLFSRKIGFLAAFLHSIHGMIIELTAGRIATDHIDLFFFSLLSWLFILLLFLRSEKACFWIPSLGFQLAWQSCANGSQL